MFSAFCLFLLVTLPLMSIAGVGNTKHNLSTSGPGGIKAVSEDQVCIFCHTPHNAFPATPLWNHELTYVENYVNYWSPTLKSYTSEADAPPIDGFSRLCFFSLCNFKLQMGCALFHLLLEVPIEQP